ncbi:hypothetical protein BGX29_002913 [Mortierella sp. GBA35]|nr:hypothetical protein BGX29_002913 [Mortierella sp. GBA35]
MSLPPRPRPRIIIVGAGLGGLMLGTLLDKMDVPYHIYERALEVKPLGALMSFTGNVFKLFDQLGMIEEVYNVSIPIEHSLMLSEDLKVMADFVSHDYENMSKVPSEKISMGKKVISVVNNPEGVKIICSDGTSYDGDILAGADGAYSTIREHMHADMAKEGTLSKADAQDLAVPYVCMVGTTTPRDPEKYPELKDSVAHLHHVIGRSTRYSWTTITIPDNRICWSVMAQVKSSSEAKQLRANNTEWGPEAAESMIKEVHDFPIKLGGGVLGDMIDATPSDGVSKVMLEEKLFKKWSHGRAVLIGDDYQSQRYKNAKRCIAASKINAKISSGQTVPERLLRYLVFNFVPKWVIVKTLTKHVVYRPQATFLPPIADMGTVPSRPQKPSKRYQAELAAAVHKP